MCSMLIDSLINPFISGCINWLLDCAVYIHIVKHVSAFYLFPVVVSVSQRFIPSPDLPNQRLRDLRQSIHQRSQMDPVSFFKVTDASDVTWGHAVNSQALLTACLADGTLFVLQGSVRIRRHICSASNGDCRGIQSCFFVETMMMLEADVSFQFEDTVGRIWNQGFGWLFDWSIWVGIDTTNLYYCSLGAYKTVFSLRLHAVPYMAHSSTDVRFVNSNFYEVIFALSVAFALSRDRQSSNQASVKSIHHP